MSAGEPRQASERPRLLKPLPPPAEDTSVAFRGCLEELLRLTGRGAEPAGTAAPGWQMTAMRALRRALKSCERLPEEWFEPLIRAGIYDPNPSSNRMFIEPAVAFFGRRRVMTLLIDRLRNGTNAERAGAPRAWYWAEAGRVYIGHPNAGMTPESKKEYEAVADLRAEWYEAELREFVSNEDIDVRRCILPNLPLRASFFPPELQAMVAEAVGIARAHPDHYIRHRVEVQLGD